MHVVCTWIDYKFTYHHPLPKDISSSSFVMVYFAFIILSLFSVSLFWISNCHQIVVVIHTMHVIIAAASTVISIVFFIVVVVVIAPDEISL